jgi:multidrug resistance efflux pump
VDFYQPVQVSTNSGGLLVEVKAQLDQDVGVGDVIARFDNPVLQLELKRKQLELRASQELMMIMQSRGQLANLQAEQATLESLQTQLNQLQQRVAELTVVAPCAGRVVWLAIADQTGRNFDTGKPICILAPTGTFEVQLSAAQRHATVLQSSLGTPVQVRTFDGARFTGQLEHVETSASDYLSQPLLAACYHGPIPVELENLTGSGEPKLRLLHPRISARIHLATDSNLKPGQRVYIQLPGEAESVGSTLANWLGDRWLNFKHQLPR